MRSSIVWSIGLLFVLGALSGCSGKKDENGDGTDTTTPGGTTGSEIDPSQLTDQDRVLGNNGSLITGGFTGPALALSGTQGAAELKLIDVVMKDADSKHDSYDKATFVLSAETPGQKFEATFATLLTGATLGLPVDFQGGVARGIEIGKGTGFLSDHLPKTRAHYFAAALATVKVNNATQSGEYIAFVAVIDGVRDDADKSALTSADTTDLEFHIYFPGDQVPNGRPISGVAGGTAYYYFEKVYASKLGTDDLAGVGSGLRPPEKPNKPPIPIAQFKVGGQAVTNATLESGSALAVTLDASLSTDPDGTITTYVWKIAKPDNNGSAPPPNSPTIQTANGQVVTFNFTEPGPKFIELVVGDNQNKFVRSFNTFYVDLHASIHEDTEATQPLGGGVACREGLNCVGHLFDVKYGFQRGTIVITDTGSAPAQNWHVDLYRPGNSDPAVTDQKVKGVNGKTLEFNNTEVNTTGVWRVWVWWELGANVSYTLDLSLSYTPTLVADDGGSGSLAAAPTPRPGSSNTSENRTSFRSV